jgi:hypothetical protein
VIEQVSNVCQTTIVHDAWERGQALTVHGWIYGIKDGLLRNVGLNVASSPEGIRAAVPPRRPRGRGRRLTAYFFLFAAALAFVACWEVTSACFLRLASLFFDCFCDACFCTDFGDLSPMVGFPLLSCLTFGMFVSPMAFVLITRGPGQ